MGCGMASRRLAWLAGLCGVLWACAPSAASPSDAGAGQQDGESVDDWDLRWTPDGAVVDSSLGLPDMETGGLMASGGQESQVTGGVLEETGGESADTAGTDSGEAAGTGGEPGTGGDGMDGTGGDTGGTGGVSEETGGDTGGTGGETQGETGAPDCGAFQGSGYSVCDQGRDFCGVLFTDRAGCTAVCGQGGLVCATALENLEDVCGADLNRAALPCDSGHRSDYCVCVLPSGG